MQKQKTGDIYEIYYDGVNGIIKTEYIGKVEGSGGTGTGGEGGSNLDKFLKATPTITARYVEAKATIYAKASIEAPEEIKKIELIYKGEVVATKTEADRLTEEQTFDVKNIGIGLYTVRATAGNRKNKKCICKSKKRRQNPNRTKNRTRTSNRKW